jgi:glycogen(starch) synthase
MKMISKVKQWASKVLCWFRSEFNLTPDKNAEEVQDGVTRDGECHEENEVPWTFEILWDVVANVADLFTINGEKNILIGAVVRPDTAVDEILEADFSDNSPPAMAVRAVRNKGYIMKTGKWLIHDRPPAILFDVESARDKFGNHYLEMFKKDHDFDIPHDDQEAIDAVLFGYMLAEFLTEFELQCRSNSNPTTGPHLSSTNTEQIFHQSEPIDFTVPPSTFMRNTELKPPFESTGDKICAQFHDWKCGVGLILLHQLANSITTIFTLKISCLEGEFNSKEKAHEEARQQGIFHRLYMERASALNCHVFAPISETVAEQAELVLGKHPDYVITQD